MSSLHRCIPLRFKFSPELNLLISVRSINFNATRRKILLIRYVSKYVSVHGSLAINRCTYSNLYFFSRTINRLKVFRINYFYLRVGRSPSPTVRWVRSCCPSETEFRNMTDEKEKKTTKRNTRKQKIKITEKKKTDQI